MGTTITIDKSTMDDVCEALVTLGIHPMPRMSDWGEQLLSYAAALELGDTPRDAAEAVNADWHTPDGFAYRRAQWRTLEQWPRPRPGEQDHAPCPGAPSALSPTRTLVLAIGSVSLPEAHVTVSFASAVRRRAIKALLRWKPC